jgi:hypothetical protein
VERFFTLTAGFPDEIDDNFIDCQFTRWRWVWYGVNPPKKANEEPGARPAGYRNYFLRRIGKRRKPRFWAVILFRIMNRRIDRKRKLKKAASPPNPHQANAVAGNAGGERAGKFARVLLPP